MRKSLREWREARGMRQIDLAVAAGVALSTVANIEAGRQEPRVGLAQRIAITLGVSVDQIEWPSEAELQQRRPKGRAVAA